MPYISGDRVYVRGLGRAGTVVGQGVAEAVRYYAVDLDTEEVIDLEPGVTMGYAAFTEKEIIPLKEYTAPKTKQRNLPAWW